MSKCCGIISFTYNGSQVTYGTVNGDYDGGQYCWLDSNLGAATFAKSSAHTAAYSYLFHWGRLDDGHQLRSNNSSTTTRSCKAVSGHYKFIKENSNWYSGTNPNDLWQGAAGINNPCPSGWRLPTQTELNNERLTWSNANSIGAINSSLRMPAAGWREYDDFIFQYVGTSGYYWTSTIYSNTEARCLKFTISTITLQYERKANGVSVHCILDY